MNEQNQDLKSCCGRDARGPRAGETPALQQRPATERPGEDSRQSAVGSRQSAVGSRQLAVGSRQEAGARACSDAANTQVSHRTTQFELRTSPLGRRDFLQQAAAGLPLLLMLVGLAEEEARGTDKPYNPREHFYGMGIDPTRCIGCARCAEACKTENDVPKEPFYFRTWVERYVIKTDGEVSVDSPNGGIGGFPHTTSEAGILRTFFVPKLCNHCAHAPCVQVCPVGATFITEDGVVLVDKDYCVGCRYCIQACPYGARFLDPRTRTAEKCTFCYHRLVKDLVPACVEVCPTGARIFGEVRVRSSALARFMRFNEIQVLKPHLNTEPKVYYANLDGEVR